MSGVGWMGGWMDGWVDGKAGLRIAYSNQKLTYTIKQSRLVQERFCDAILHKKCQF